MDSRVLSCFFLFLFLVLTEMYWILTMTIIKPYCTSFLYFPLESMMSIWSKMKFGKNICILNVGGTKYAFTREVIKDFPLRRVSRLHSCSSEKEVLEVCDDYDRERNEFFFDRHSEAFVFIMLYVRSGKLRFVPQMCELSFYNEMIYWGLESSHLEFCCQRRLEERMSDTFTYVSEEDIKAEVESRSEEDQVTRLAPETGNARWLERMRRTFEEPASSLAAQILASVSVVFVIMSMVILCASTLPDWDTAKNNTVEEHRYMHEFKLCGMWYTYTFMQNEVHLSQDSSALWACPPSIAPYNWRNRALLHTGSQMYFVTVQVCPPELT